ncbi:MAG: response regulator transcription factor [Chloroflexi bacterium]|nr:response regulator transcription factor [Chloroflexota bacterium]
MLAQQPGVMVEGQAAGDFDLRQTLEGLHADALVWDLGWDAADATEAVTDAQELGIPILALAPEEDHVAEAWAAGARGLLPREAGAEVIGAALHALASGLAVVAAEFTALLSPRHRQAAALAEELTPREGQVLQLLAEGLPNKAIAARLGVSESTVKFHINAILGKLGAQSRTEAVVQATRLGLITM